MFRKDIPNIIIMHSTEPAILILSLSLCFFSFVENVLYEVLCRRRMNEFH